MDVAHAYLAPRVAPVVDRTPPLSDFSEDMRYLEAGHVRGKVVITLGSESGAAS